MNMALIVDIGGNPKIWATPHETACYYAREKVVWQTGGELTTLRGGFNALTGKQSTITISSIVGVSGPLLGDDFYQRQLVHMNRRVLYRRDRNVCGYCALEFSSHNLTVDHVVPKSRGGGNTWENCVTACKRCNQAKGDRTPEQAGMPLVYVPYAVNRYEKMILGNRTILADQMEFLMARVPPHSRLHRQRAIT